MFGAALTCLFAGVVWLVFAWICRRLEGAFRGEVIADLAWGISQLYVRIVHRLRIEGREHLPRGRCGSTHLTPLIIVSNHTAGVDPILIQAACSFEIRWMMMRSMMTPAMSPFWEWLNVIPVDQNGRDSQALRTALRHLKDGGVLGIFAEGALERPPGVIMPYEAGIGLLVLKTGAQVLPVVVHGTPRSDSAFASLFLPSRAVVRFLPTKDYTTSGLDAAGIATDLELQAARTLNWPRGPRSPRNTAGDGK